VLGVVRVRLVRRKTLLGGVTRPPPRRAVESPGGWESIVGNDVNAVLLIHAQN